MLFGLLLLSLIASSSAKTFSDFIQHIHSSDDFRTMILMRFTNNLKTIGYFDELQVIAIPKVIFRKHQFRGLKLERDFNSDLLSIIFIDKASDLKAVMATLRFNKLSKIVITSSTLDAHEALQILAEHGFVNSIFVRPSDFRNSSIFYSYQLFPKLEVKTRYFEKSAIVFPAKIDNIARQPINIGFVNAFPSSYIVFDKKLVKWRFIGFLNKFLQTFGKFIYGVVYITRKLVNLTYL